MIKWIKTRLAKRRQAKRDRFRAMTRRWYLDSSDNIMSPELIKQLKAGGLGNKHAND